MPIQKSSLVCESLHAENDSHRASERFLHLIKRDLCHAMRSCIVEPWHIGFLIISHMCTFAPVSETHAFRLLTWYPPLILTTHAEATRWERSKHARKLHAYLYVIQLGVGRNNCKRNATKENRLMKSFIQDHLFLTQ